MECITDVYQKPVNNKNYIEHYNHITTEAY